MTRAVPSVRLGVDASVSPPVSGVQLGMGAHGAVALRLFRLQGTRVTVAGLVEAAQLLALRTATAGSVVQVLTARPHLWEPLLRHSSGSRIHGPRDPVDPPGGPSLLVDDRPERSRNAAPRLPWQCVLDVRGQWRDDDVAALLNNDLTVLGSVPVQLLASVASAFALPRDSADQLAHVQPGSVAVVRRGRIDIVALNPGNGEYQLIEGTRGVRQSGAPAAVPARLR